MPGLSARCEAAAERLASEAVVILAASLALLAAGASHGQASQAPPHSYWIEAAPATPEESAIAAVYRLDPFLGPLAKVEALERVAAGAPGTPVAGLARIAAGRLLLETGRAAEAAAMLRAPEVPRSLLADHGLLALGTALEPRDPAAAGAAFMGAAEARPDGPLACDALLAAAEAFKRADSLAKAVAALETAVISCTSRRPEALLALGRAYERRGSTTAAAARYDDLDRDFPASPEARAAAPRLQALAHKRPVATPDERRARALAKADALIEARRYAEAIRVLHAIPMRGLPREQADGVHVRLGRACVPAGRTREAQAALLKIPPGSPHEAEAAFLLARLAARRARKAAPYADVVSRFPGTPWAEESLVALANDQQKDARDEAALPWYRRLLEEFPDGRYVERATWRVGIADFRAGRFEEAARLMERVARQRPQASTTPVFLYWTGRAREARGRTSEARALFEETARRFKRSYHGVLAQRALERLPAVPTALPPAILAAGPPGLDVGEPALSRIRQLLLIERWAEAIEELRALPRSTTQQATIAWAEWKRGRLRSALAAMRRAYPEWVGEAGDRLPEEAWRILYPLEHADALRQKALEEELDPALVAALVLQESSFDADAVSAAGARGLMQVMPPTGRTLARQLGVRYRRSMLHDPETSLDFGTHYLRSLIERFGGQVERALAAYNAGPHRVDAWTAERPDLSAEEFVEAIPFTETRYYVMNVLAAREQYRQLYALGAAPGPGGGQATEGGSR
jgi:soluble lytic murein transglycosylase